MSHYMRIQEKDMVCAEKYQIILKISTKNKTHGRKRTIMNIFVGNKDNIFEGSF